MSKPIIAAQMYTVCAFMKTDEQFVESIKKVKAIGYNTVQLSGHTAVSADCVTETLRNEGIKCCITHSPFDRLLNDFDKIVSEHKAWGCNRIGTGSMPGGFTYDPKGYREFAKVANEVADELAKHGMKFAYHNHSHEFIDFDGVKGMDILIGETGENFEFIPDCYWLQYAGVNPYGWLYKIKGRVSTIHYKDFKVNPENSQPMFCEIGKGNMDYRLLTDVCEEIGVKYAAVEQDTCPGDPFDSLKISYDYLRSIGL